jgi:AraC-like DNA-binding protein/ligand-binding sensor protein
MQTTFVRHAAETGEAPSQARAGTGAGASPGLGRGTGRARRTKPADLRPRGSAGANADRALVEALANSRVFQDYERAFTEATGLPVALRAVESWQLPHHGHPNESPFCALVLETSRACASCLQVQEKLSVGAAEEACTVNCPAGLCDTAVPVHLGERVIGFLQTGQVFRKAPTRSQFQRTLRLVAEWGVNVDPAKLEQAYFNTRVVPNRKHEAVVKLLSIFAQHLSLLSNQVLLQQDNPEPLAITRAKEYIREHQTENLRLGHVAKAVNTSTFYFCKMFKKATGINFTDYLSRVRIEKSKNLLLNPNLRVSEIAFEVGFQSLTHFNRVFKKVLGQSPTEYRAQLLGPRQSPS